MRKLIDLDALSRYHQKLKASYQNDLTATAAGRALDARQGKALQTLADEMGVHLYTHQRSGTAHLLTGSGAVGRAYVTAAYQSGDAFFVNGAAVTAYAGESTVDELPAGRWVTFVYDAQRATINFKQGGAGLNVQVIAASAQPQSPKENTVWVNTSVPMTRWRYNLYEPGSPVQGDVWLYENKTLCAHPINALRRNEWTMYPSGCKQYIGGAWTEKECRVYVGQAWMKLTDYLLYNGEINAEQTGGFTATVEGACEHTETAVAGKGIDLWLRKPNTTSVNPVYRYRCASPIPLDSVHTVGALMQTVVTAVDDLKYATVELEILNTSLSRVAAQSKTYGPGGASVASENFSVDVSALTGSYYVGFAVTLNGDNWQYTLSATIKTLNLA